MIPIFVPATPLRPAYRPLLVDRLGGPDVVEVLVDEHMTGAWPNLRRCLERGLVRSYERGFDTFATVHEDVYPVDDFQKHLTNAVAAQPGKFFSGFVQNVSQREPVILPHAYSNGFHWTYYIRVTSQCFVWPVSIARSFIEWADTAVREFGFWDNTLTNMRDEDKDDFVVMAYLCSRQITCKHGPLKVLVTVPCLVQHLGSGQSTAPDIKTGRFQKWVFEAQKFVNPLLRSEWLDLEYLDPSIYKEADCVR